MARLTSTARLLLAALWLTACGGAGAHQGANAPESGTEADGDSTADVQSADGAATTAPSRTAKAPLPPVGTQNLDRRGLSMEFGLTLVRDDDVAAGVQTGNWSFEEERTHRVKAVGSDAVSELEVVYGKWEAKPLLGLVYEVPTDGKTYLIKAGDAEPTVTRAQNEPMTSAELEAVTGEYGYVGGEPTTLKALDAAGGQSGTALDVNPSLIRALIGAIPGVNHEESDMTARFVGYDEAGSRRTAKLELTLVATLRSGETEFKFDLKGPATVDMLTGWVTSVSLEGPLHPAGKVKVGKQTLNARGKGTVKYTRTASYK